MKRTLKVFTAVLACFFASVPIKPGSLAENNSPTDYRHRATEPTVQSVLTQAKDLAETSKYGVDQIPLRKRIAIAMRRTGQELTFGDYVTNSIAAWEKWDPVRAEYDRSSERFIATARKYVQAGNNETAETLLRKIGCETRSPPCRIFNIDRTFLTWEIEDKNFSAAASRVKKVSWQWVSQKKILAHNLAKALIDEGKKEDAFSFLSELASASTNNRAALAEVYWVLGATEQGKKLLREAVEAELNEARSDIEKPLPIHHVGVQWIMGDKNGQVKRCARFCNLTAPVSKRSKHSLQGDLHSSIGI